MDRIAKTDFSSKRSKTRKRTFLLRLFDKSRNSEDYVRMLVDDEACLYILNDDPDNRPVAFVNLDAVLASNPEDRIDQICDDLRASLHYIYEQEAS